MAVPQNFDESGSVTQPAAEQRTALSPRRVCEPWVNMHNHSELRSSDRILCKNFFEMNSVAAPQLETGDGLPQGSQTRLGLNAVRCSAAGCVLHWKTAAMGNHKHCDPIRALPIRLGRN